MGLYLCIFDGDDELEGVEVGAYADFESFRSTVTSVLEGGVAGAKYPSLILHSDCCGEWSQTECKVLKQELRSISEAFRQLPPVEFHADWQLQVGKLLGLQPSSLYDSFIDVDGEPLLERLEGLCNVAIQNGQPILLQ